MSMTAKITPRLTGIEAAVAAAAAVQLTHRAPHVQNPRRRGRRVRCAALRCRLRRTPRRERRVDRTASTCVRDEKSLAFF